MGHYLAHFVDLESLAQEKVDQLEYQLEQEKTFSTELTKEIDGYKEAIWEA